MLWTEARDDSPAARHAGLPAWPHPPRIQDFARRNLAPTAPTPVLLQRVISRWGTSFVHVRFTFFLLYIHTHPLSVSDSQSGKLKRKGKGKRRNTHENIADGWERNTTSLKPRKKAAGYEMVYVWTRGSCRRVAPGTTLVKAQSRANCRARSPPFSVARTRVQFRQPARMETGGTRDGTKPRGSRGKNPRGHGHGDAVPRPHPTIPFSRALLI